MDLPSLHDQVEGGDEAGPVRARLAVEDGRILDLVEEFLGGEDRLPVGRAAGADDELVEIDAEPLAGLLLELPGAVLAAAAQVDDGAHALGLEARDLVRRRLGRAPQAVGDLVLVQVEEAEDPVIGEQHMGPGAHAPGRAPPRAGPSGRCGPCGGHSGFQV